MKTRGSLLTFFLAITLVGSTNGHAAEKPNLLFILADDCT